MTKSILVTLAAFSMLPPLSPAQPLDPASLFKALGDSWPTYAGDYSSKRYSSLQQVN